MGGRSAFNHRLRATLTVQADSAQIDFITVSSARC